VYYCPSIYGQGMNSPAGKKADSAAGQPVSNRLSVPALNFNSGLGPGDEFPGCHASEAGSKPGRWVG
jgi:hypothetical protein